MQKNTFQNSPELLWVERVSRLLDSKFRIPGTSIRFGLDPVFGLLPVAGDLATMLISLSLIYTMFQNGASGKLVAKMILNALLDLIIGSIPVIGTVFDVYFKANNRNVELLRQYYQEGKHGGSALGVIIPVLLVLMAIAFLFIYVTWILISYTIDLLGG